MTARSRVLARIRERQRKPPHASSDELGAVLAHIAQHPRNPGPREEYEPLARFQERALSLSSSIDPVASRAEVPSRVAAYLLEQKLPLDAVCWRELVDLDWRASGIRVEARSARADDLVGITGACCAIAETGTLVTLSGADSPPTVSLLPETHVAVLSRARILRTMEEAWALIRAEQEALPRAVTFISGPSRTADIEQTVTLGAHGPYRVHIIITRD